jgi:hypothetical protein
MLVCYDALCNVRARSSHLQNAVACIDKLDDLHTAIDDAIGATEKEVTILICPGCARTHTAPHRCCCPRMSGQRSRTRTRAMPVCRSTFMLGGTALDIDFANKEDKKLLIKCSSGSSGSSSGPWDSVTGGVAQTIGGDAKECVLDAEKMSRVVEITHMKRAEVAFVGITFANGETAAGADGGGILTTYMTNLNTNERLKLITKFCKLFQNVAKAAADTVCTLVRRLLSPATARGTHSSHALRRARAGLRRRWRVRGRAHGLRCGPHHFREQQGGPRRWRFPG